MRRELVQALKKIDKIVGTPVCHLLGFMDGIFFRICELSLNPQKILVIKLIAVGDLVASLPTLRTIKKRFPESHLVLLATPRVKEVIEGCKYLDEIIYYDILGKDKGIKGLLKIIDQLRKRGFDLVFDMEQYYRITTLIAYMARIKYRVGFDLPGQGRKYLFNIKVPYLVNKHEVEVFLEVAKQIGADISEKELEEIYVPDEDKEYVNKFLIKEGVAESDLLIGIHPGTGPSAISRRWEPDKFGSLADWLIKEHNAKVIFTGTNSEVGLIKEIRRFMYSDPIIAVGKTNLKQMAEIARRCRLFISVDTGPLHVAAAMKTKVIGIYGPTTPLKWGPYGDGHIAIYKGLKCSPCNNPHLGQTSKCTDPVCMHKISVEDVQTAVLHVLKTHPFPI